jgi:nicotinamidase-related amidase
MERLDASRCALVLVDYQARLMPAIDDSDAVLAAALLVADAARLLGIPVVGTEQNPQGLGRNVGAIRERCAVTLAKSHFDACSDGLLPALQREREHGRGHWRASDEREGAARPDGADAARSMQIVIAGCEAHVCLMQTALGLLRAGHRLWVVEAACGSRRPSDRRLGLQRLHDAGAVLASPEMVLFEWLRESDHPRFREVLALVKALPA